ncbi:hypothetical protein OG216_45890 (plasmid) [Streptomycetaceae bacterium NBC_01309]
MSLAESSATETVREVAQGLVQAAADYPCQALRQISVGALPGASERAFAKSWRSPGGIHTISFNSRWHSREAREHFLRALREAEAQGLLPVGTPAGLARIRMLAPGIGGATPDEYQARVSSAEDIPVIETELRAALSAVLDRDVAVVLQPDGGRAISLESSREIARGLIETAVDFPATRLRAVRFGTLSSSHTFAETVVTPPDFESVVTFGSWWHSSAGRLSYLSALRRNHRTGRLVERTPADVAAHEFMHAVSFSAPNWMDADHVAGHPLTLADELALHLAPASGQKFRRVVRAISSTATQNDHELVAEAAMDVRLNGPSAQPISRLVHDRLLAAHRQLVPERVGQSSVPGQYLHDVLATVDTALRGLESAGGARRA